MILLPAVTTTVQTSASVIPPSSLKHHLPEHCAPGQRGGAEGDPGELLSKTNQAGQQPARGRTHHTPAVLTSNLWLLTFLPFLFQTILGWGSPEAWQTKEDTPPWTPVWSSGVRVNLGGAARGRARLLLLTPLTGGCLTHTHLEHMSQSC